MRRMLELALIDTLFVIALGTCAFLYGGHVHVAGTVAIVAVLVVWASASAYALRIAGNGGLDTSGHIGFAANVCPAIGIAGVASGFLVALSSGTEDIQDRVVGASSGLAATVVAVMCMVLLDVQAHMLRPARGCECERG